MHTELFGTINGRDVIKYTFGSKEMRVSVLDYGAALQSLVVDGVDVVLGYSRGEEYAVRGGYLGAYVGRAANRIKDAVFTLNGAAYSLTKNEGENHLHGGKRGFSHHFYAAEKLENGVKLRAVSPDGDEGYPGTMTHSVTYLAEGRTLRILFEACSDRDTVWSPTCHAYFNLNGEVGNAVNNYLTLFADRYTPTDAALIPLGTTESVENTVFDFRTRRPIENGGAAHGEYDINFILSGSHAATLEGDISGLCMDIYTDLPCMQLYTAFQDMNSAPGKRRSYGVKEGIALEAQYAPNAVNMDGFAKPILPAGVHGKHYITYSFR